MKKLYCLLILVFLVNYILAGQPESVIDNLESKIDSLSIQLSKSIESRDAQDSLVQNELSDKVSNLIKDITKLKTNLKQQKQKIYRLDNGIDENLQKTRKQIRNIRLINENHLLRIDSLDIFAKEIKKESKDKDSVLLVKINDVSEDTKENEVQLKSSVARINDSISKRTLYIIIAILILAIAALVIYILLSKKIFKNKDDLYDNIKKTRESFKKESVQLDNKLVELLNKQLKILKEKPEAEEDHSLALRVADEIIRINKNLSHMDDSIKGKKRLKKSVERIQDNFESKGYEIVDMIGKKYNEKMHVTANFIPDNSLSKGEQIITRIIKPQVNFQGKMIQQAQIEVSHG